jgi:teichuronic acid biosynthesis glycosyltransferase TuaH
VVFGTALWDAPWLTEQNLAAALARRHAVLYLEPEITPLTPFRYGLRDDTAAELARLASRSVRWSGGVGIARPVVLPPREHPVARRLSTGSLRRQLRRAARRTGLGAPVAVTTRYLPETFGAAGEALRVHLVKDWVTAGGALMGRNGRRLLADELAACRAADLVCVTSRQLRATLSEHGIDSVHLPHGFHSDLAPSYDGAPLPPEYHGLPAPRIGYAGRLDGRIDYDLLAQLADRMPHVSIVLIGPVSPRLDPAPLERLRSRPNVHMLGPRARAELPGYLRHLDCALVPWRASEWSRHASPLKLWDYLYAGPPVVGTGGPALAEYPSHLVRYASEPDDFVPAVAAALAGGADGRAERGAFALANSWDARAAQLDELVDATIATRSESRTAPP